MAQLENTSGRTPKRTWVIAGVVVAVALTLIGAFAVGMFFLISGIMKDNDAYRGSVQTLQANTQAMQILGAPITAGFPMGSINTKGTSGNAELAIPIKGQKASGTLYVQATMTMGVWKPDRLEMQIEGGERIDLIRGGTPI
jgi:hypothetical protein